jgi:RHS repeat-associated protein
MSIDAESAVPPLRSFQYDTAALAEIANCVNLFRGAVTMPVDLVTLAGVNGLDVNVRATYNGKAATTANRWNRDNPTGILGLGWDIPFEYVGAPGLALADSPNDAYYLVSGGSANALIRLAPFARPAQRFQLDAFQFWTIVYDPTKETWTVTRENGVVYVYGDASSGRGTVQYNVRWRDWTGSSVALGQARYASAWNLSEIRSPWGDTITFTYGLVSEAVGRNGLTYTKACHLHAIEDPFGRTVTFVYKDKLFQPGNGVCEYQDPNKVAPSNSPDAYQSRYETKYLDGIVVRSAQNATLFTIAFGYEIAHFTKLEATDPAYPFLAKRCLTSITQSNPDGASLPGLTFTYQQRTDVFPAALATMTFPAGAVAAFTYKREEIQGTGRSIEIAAPAAGAVPRVWHGPNYVVVTWTTPQRLYLTVYSWNGRWVTWTPPQPIPAVPAAGSLVVIPRPDFFVVTLRNGAASRDEFWAFRPDPSMQGAWTFESHTAPVSAGAPQTVLASGSGFYTAYNPRYVGPPFVGYAWNWTVPGWRPLPPPSIAPAATTTVRLGAVANAYVLAAFDTVTKLVTFQVVCRDPSGVWQTRQSWTSAAAVQSLKDEPAFEIAFGDCFLFLAFASTIQPGDPGTIGYSVRAWQLDDSFNPLNPSAPFVLASSVHVWTGTVNLAPLALAYGDALLSNNRNLMRFTGDTANPWNVGKLNASDANGVKCGFAYGKDVALVSQSAGGSVTNALAWYDPNVSAWKYAAVPSQGTQPTVSGGVATAGSYVLVRAADGTWKPARTQLRAGLVDASVQNWAPAYLAYQDAGGSARVALFRNGNIASDEVVKPNLVLSVPNGGPGTILSSPSAFVAYAAGTPFDAATSLSLFQVAGDSMLQPLCDHPATSVTLDDGYSGGTPYVQSYAYDQSTSTFDAATGLAQYGRVRSAVGAADPSTSTLGYTDNFFSNGFSTQAAPYLGGSPMNYRRVLNGTLLAQEMVAKDGTATARIVNGFEVRTRVQKRDGSWSQLHGAYFVPVLRRQMRDGVRSEISLEYDFATGQQKQTITTSYDADGLPVRHRDVLTHASRFYPEMAGLNMLAQVAVKTKYSTTGSASETLDARTVTTWQAWAGFGPACWASHATYDWRGTGDATFLPAWWTGDTPPSADWLGTSVTTVRTSRSQPARALDSAGTIAASIFAADQMMPVADFHNASPETTGAAFFSFEPYEDPAERWLCAPPSGGVVTTGDSRAGTSCFQITGTASLSRTLSVTAPRKAYVVCGWVKTSADFAGTLGWSFGFGNDAPQRQPVQPTNGAWTFSTWTVTSNPAPGSSTMRIALDAAPSAGFVRADALAVFPADSAFSARALDMALRIPTSQLGSNGEVTTTYLDAFARPLAVEAAGRVASIKQAYNPGTASTPPFSASNPHRVTTLTAQNGGFAGTFADGDAAAWRFTGSASAWTIKDRALQFSGTAASPFAATATRNGFTSPDLAIRVRVSAPSAAAAVGTGDFFVTYDPAATAWQLVQLHDGTPTVLATASHAQAAGDWFLTIVDGRIMFTAGAAPVFDLVVPAARQNAGLVVLGLAGPGSFSQLIVAAKPTYTVSFLDGTLKARQSVRLVDAATGTRGATLYDVLLRPAANTRRSMVSLGPAIAYDPSYVMNGAPGQSLWQGKPIEGSIAALHPDAGGYPFSRTFFEPSPLGRETQRGLPGADFAIRPGNAHVQTWAYGTNTSADSPKLPAGKYFVTTTSDADGVRTRTLSDMLATPLLVREGITDDGGTAVESAFRYSTLGMITSAIPPAAATGVAPLLTAYDYLGRVAAKTSPDNGTSRSMYDDAGQLRFVQPAGGADPSNAFVVYQKFDPLGRVLESGTVPFLWNASTEAQLRAHAADPNWPSDGTTWSNRYSYDFDGAQARNALGRLWKVESNNAKTGTADVVETLSYDVSGLVTSRTLTCAEFDTVERKVTFAYDNLSNVVHISTGGPEPDVVVGYDRLERAAIVGTPDAPDCYAGYTYDAEDNVVDERLGPAAAKALDRTYAFTPAGWPSSIVDSTFSERLTYTSGGYQGAAYWNGNVAGADTVYTALSGAGGAQQFAHDPLGRLRTIATAGKTEQIAYDPNGNVQSVTSGGTPTVISYVTGSNKLRHVGGDATDYGYDADGNVTAAPVNAMTIGYDPGTQRPLRIKLSRSRNVTFAYGDKGTRVLKTDSAGPASLLYVHGTAPSPLLEIRRGSAGDERRQLVYGATGLIAMRSGDTVWYISKDHLGSVRVVVDRAGSVVAAYDYSPYGVTRSLIEGSPDIRYLFTGQEFDAETGLYNFKARLYEPRLGRFYGIDPAGQQPSPYVYVANAPLRFVDRSGADFGFSFLVAVLIGIAVGAVAGAAAYAIVNRNHFSWRDFGIAVGVGALGGGIAGAVGFAGPALLALGAQTIGAATVAQSATFAVLTSAGFGAAGSVLGQLTSNAILGVDLDEGLGLAALTGAIAGGVAGGIGWRMNVGKQVGLHGTSSNFVESITKRVNPPTPGANFGGRAQFGEGFYTSTDRLAAQYFANTSVVNSGGNASYLRIFSRNASSLSTSPVVGNPDWALPWAGTPVRGALIANFDALEGTIAGIGRPQLKFNPRAYTDLWAFPEQPTGMWRYLSL